LNHTSKESSSSSMLDRRLASTDRKRTQKDELMAAGGDWKSGSSAGAEVDLDQDLAEIGRYFARRNPTGVSKYDVEVRQCNFF